MAPRQKNLTVGDVQLNAMPATMHVVGGILWSHIVGVSKTLKKGPVMQEAQEPLNVKSIKIDLGIEVPICGTSIHNIFIGIV